MIKSIQILCFLVISLLISCTVSEEERAADEQRHRDSVAAAQAMIRAAQQASETRANALNIINQDALKLDSVLRKDSVGVAKKDSSVFLSLDTVQKKKEDVVKPKSNPSDPKKSTAVTTKKTTPAGDQKKNTVKPAPNSKKPDNKK